MAQNIQKNEFNTMENVDATDPQERMKPTVDRRLEEVEYMLDRLEQSGVPNQTSITEEKVKLESELADKLTALKAQIGNENISAESEGMIREHVVDEVIAFRKKVLDQYNKLVTQKQELDREKNPTVTEIAREATTVGSFKNSLESAAAQKDAGKDIKDAAENITRIAKGHEQYKVEQDIPESNGIKPAGITEMNASGGGQITIEANHLASVGTASGKIEVNQTLDHEAIHGNQTRLHSSEDGTVIVDPTNNRKMSEAELHEGGAVHGTKDHGGRDDTKAADVYKQGKGFYDRNNSTIINKHVEKDGDNAGDRVHLQAELAKDARVNSKKDLLELAKKAGFSDIETARFLKLMAQKDKTANPSKKQSLAA